MSTDDETKGPTIEDVERLAETIYEEMRAADPEGARYPWIPGGNSHKQREARDRACVLLAVRIVP